MNNKVVLLFLLLLSSLLGAKAQVGVNTEDPSGMFHIDGKGNNKTDKKNADDLFIGLSAKDGEHAVMGIGAVPENIENLPVQLELGAPNSAFIPNKIALTSTTDVTTIPDPVAGMIIINTTNDPGKELLPALYYYNGDKWKRLYTSAHSQVIQFRELYQQITLEDAGDGGENAPNGKAKLLKWTDPNDGSLAQKSYDHVYIYEKGTYSFTFRLYTTLNRSKSYDIRVPLYLWVQKNRYGTSWPITNSAEVDMVYAMNSNQWGTAKDIVTYTLTLTAKCNEGDKIYFMASAKPNSGDASNNNYLILNANPRTSLDQLPMPNRCSMVFWKL